MLGIRARIRLLHQAGWDKRLLAYTREVDSALRAI